MATHRAQSLSSFLNSESSAHGNMKWATLGEAVLVWRTTKLPSALGDIATAAVAILSCEGSLLSGCLRRLCCAGFLARRAPFGVSFWKL